MHIHPTAEVAVTAEIGEGTRIWHEAQIRDRVTIGTNCILGKGAYVDADVVIGNNVKIQNRASIYKDCVLEDGVFIGPHVCFTNDVLPRAINVDGTLKSEADWHPGRTTVGYGASVGAGSVILPSLSIGRHALIGAGTVLTKDVPPHGLVVGNPGRLIGYACACGSRLVEQDHGMRCTACDAEYTWNASAQLEPASEEAAQPASHLTVAVVGLGKVGLPLAVQYATRGATVIGCDINPNVVAMVNAGETPILEEHDLANRLADVSRRGLLRATTDTVAGVGEADVVVIIVPLMVDHHDHQIDFRIIDSATATVASGLKPGTLVVYETTLPVGTTRNRFGKILAEGSGLTLGEDFQLAFSPERIRTGRIFRDLATYPKVVGGTDQTSTDQAAAFYRAVLSAEVMEVSSAEAAELTKLMETAFRDVNIALANEFAKFASSRDIDVREAIDAANSQPQSMIHEPGVGVGGHCIPVYPYFMMQGAEQDELQLMRTSRVINDTMATHAVERIEAELGSLQGATVLMLGLAYRANVKEHAFSSALLLQQELQAAGATVLTNDPLYNDAELEAAGVTPVQLENVEQVDVIIIQANHAAYSALSPEFFGKARVVLDGRGDTDWSTINLGDTAVIQVGVPLHHGNTRKRLPVPA